MKIPENANPYRAIVNGVEHAYEAGAETTVAPGVAELINAADNFPPAAEEVQPPFAGGGGGGGATIVHANLDAGGAGSLDKTAGEIIAAWQTGPVVLIESTDGFGVIGAGPASICRTKSGGFQVSSASLLLYEAANANDYPATP